MKLFFTLLAIFLCLSNATEFGKKFKSNLLGKDKVGVSSNRGQSELAVSYSVANTNVDQFYAQNQNDYKKPQYVSSLPKRASLNTGEQFTPEVNEKPSNNDYYDGTQKLHLRK